MKNLHLLPTDKPSRLTLLNNERLLFSKEDCELSKTKRCVNQHIYITSDEEIKEGDWFIRKNKIHQLRWDDGNGNLYTKNGLKIYKSSSKKIILTTDTDLITDGVQSIDDEFIQWYIQNPSCEWVEIEKYFHEVGDAYDYEIIIPKEELKETLEKAAEKYCLINNIPIDQMIVKTDRSCEFETPITMFIAGAKWQSERMYSEEEVESIWKFALYSAEQHDKFGTKNKSDFVRKDVEEFIKQLKK